MMVVRFMGTLLLTLCASTLAFAQAQPPQDRINTALDRARQVGIPLSLLENKMAEGKAKGVSLERIAATIERRLQALERAQAAIGRQPDGAESLSVGADAIESGVSEAALKAVAQDAPRERRSVAIAVLTELVEQGHASETALARVRGALERGPDALTNLPAQARADAARRGGAGTRGAGAPTDGAGAAGPPAAVPSPGGNSQGGRPQGSRPSGPPASTPGRGRQ